MSLTVADWRRRIAELYADIRAMPPAEGHALWVRMRADLFATHPATPLADPARSPVTVRPYDPGFRIEAPVRAAEGPEIAAELGADGRLTYRPALVAETPFGDLTVFWLTGYGGGLFLPFQDASSGGLTYGGGRYLLDSVKGADLGMAGERLILDFNFAYHPSCALNPAWVCPLSPPDNRLAPEIPVGEVFA